MPDDAASALERTISRLLEQCQRSLRSGNAWLARQEMDGAVALRRIADRLRS